MHAHQYHHGCSPVLLLLLNEGLHSDDAYSVLVSRGKFYKIFFLSDIRLSSSFNTGGGSRRVDH